MGKAATPKTEKKKVDERRAEPATAYQVMMQDEYDNLYLLGLYASLDDAIPDVNGFIEGYDGAKPFGPGDLAEYAGTFGPCFDREVEWDDEDECPGCVMVRGFALDAAELAGEAKKIAARHKEN